MSVDALILAALQIIIAIILGLVIKSYLPAYFSKKGENLATKEDVEEITSKVEEIRHIYARRQHISEKSFDKEFQILSEIWTSLIELRNSVLSLRPVVDYVNPNETEEERIQKRLSEFAKCHDNFTKMFTNNQPFYPKEIFDELIDLSRVMYGEAVDYKHSKVTQRDLDNYWKKAEENQNKVISSIDRIGELIRRRVSLD